MIPKTLRTYRLRCFNIRSLIRYVAGVAQGVVLLLTGLLMLAILLVWKLVWKRKEENRSGLGPMERLGTRKLN